jgi:glycosyltransferase involved in cell wall biosynthesis
MMGSILIILENFPAYGGVERVTTLLANYLAEIGRKVTILSIRGLPDQDLLNALHRNVTARTLPLHMEIDGVASRDFLHGLIRDQGVDVILNQGLHYQLTRLSLAVAKDAQCSYVSVLHNTPDAHRHILDAMRAGMRFRPGMGLKHFAIWGCWWGYKRYSMRKISRFYRYVYANSDHVVLLSRSFIPQFVLMSGVDSCNKLISIPNPLTFDDEVVFSDLNKVQKIIYIGRFDRVQKRVDRVINIFKALSAKHPEWELHLVGDGDQLSELRTLSAGVDAIKFWGSVADTRPHLRDASVLLLTSEFEGFGMVLTEALQFGVVPMAYASYSAIHDIIIDGVNGYSVTPFDQAEFIAKLDGLMSDPGLLMQMSRMGLESSGRFKKDVVLRQWLPLLDKKID